MNAEKFFTHPLGILLSAACSTFLWGSAFPFIKLSYVRLGIERTEIGEQLLFAGYRFFLAGLMIVLFFLLMKKNMKLQKADLMPIAKAGFLQTFLQYVLFYIGLSYSTGIQGSIIAGTTSFFQILFAHFYYDNDKLTVRRTMGLLVGFSGVLAVNLTRGKLAFSIGIGEVLLLLAMAAGAYGNILAREGTKKMEVGLLTSYQMLLGSAGLILIGLFSVGVMPFRFDMIAIEMLLYLSFLSAAGFLLWNNVMKYNQVGQISIYLFLVPIFGVLLSSILLDEAIGIYVLLGLMLVTAGILIVNKKKTSSASMA